MFGKIKRGIARVAQAGKAVINKALLGIGVAGGVFAASQQHASAQTDIASTITTLSTYETTAIVIGIAILLYSVGRMIVHKVTRG